GLAPERPADLGLAARAGRAPALPVPGAETGAGPGRPGRTARAYRRTLRPHAGRGFPGRSAAPARRPAPASGPAGHARGGLPPGLGAPGRADRRRRVPRPRHRRHPAVGQAPVHLAAGAAGGAVVRPAGRPGWPGAGPGRLPAPALTRPRQAPRTAQAGLVESAPNATPSRPRTHLAATRASWRATTTKRSPRHVQRPVLAGSLPECPAPGAHPG